MRAVVYDRYGSPDVLRIEEVERPVPKDDEVLIRIRATTVNRTDCGWRQGKPFFSRYFTGLRRPRKRILGSELAGEVEAVGAGGDRVRGRRPGLRRHRLRRPRGVRLRAGELSPRSHACRPELRGGGGGLRRCDPRHGLPGKGRSPAGAQHPHLRRLRIDRNRSGAAGPGARCRRDGRVQHQEPRAREVARSRPRDRLHAGGLHAERRDVRRRLRRGRPALVQAVSPLAEAGRALRRDRPRVHVARPVPGPAEPVGRRQEGDARDPEVHEGERPPPQGADRGGEVPGGHRSHLPAGRRGRGDPVRRDVPEDGERRPHGQRRAAASDVRDTAVTGVASSRVDGARQVRALAYRPKPTRESRANRFR